MKQAIAMAMVRARDSVAGDYWRMAGALLDVAIPIVLTGVVVASLIYLSIAQFR